MSLNFATLSVGLNQSVEIAKFSLCFQVYRMIPSKDVEKRKTMKENSVSSFFYLATYSFVLLNCDLVSRFPLWTRKEF